MMLCSGDLEEQLKNINKKIDENNGRGVTG